MVVLFEYCSKFEIAEFFNTLGYEQKFWRPGMTSAVTPASDITVPTSEVGCKAEVAGAIRCRAEVDEDGVVPAGSRTIISAEDRHIWILGEVFLE